MKKPELHKSQLTEIHKAEWFYILYEVDKYYLLSVLCGTIALFDRNVILDSKQTLEYKKFGLLYINALASKIRYSPNKYSKDHVIIK